MIGCRPKILFVACTPVAKQPSTGVDQRLRILFDRFTAIGDVHFHQPDPPARVPGTTTVPLGSLRDHASWSAAIHPNLRWHRPKTLPARRFMALQPEKYDIVFLHRLGAAWWTGWTDSERTILDIDDVPSQILLDRIRFGTTLKRLPRHMLYQWMRRSERRALDAFRYSLVCSDDDRRYLCHPRVAVIPNAYYLPRDEEGPERVEGRGSMLFVGSLGYPPNPEGLTWFVRDVLPRIRERVAEATLTVVGRLPRRGSDHFAWKNAAGVHLLGEVQSVSPYINACRFEVCPIIRGQGTRIKILESLAHGKPVVSTTVGAHGIDIGEDQGLIRKDDPDSFAASCVNLLLDPSHGAAAALRGRRWVLAHASRDAIGRRLEGLVEAILVERGIRTSS